MSLYANQTVSYFHVHRFNDCFINRSSAGMKNQITLAAYFRFRSHYSFVQKIFNFHSFGRLPFAKSISLKLKIFSSSFLKQSVQKLNILHVASKKWRIYILLSFSPQAQTPKGLPLPVPNI